MTLPFKIFLPGQRVPDYIQKITEGHADVIFLNVCIFYVFRGQRYLTGLIPWRQAFSISGATGPFTIEGGDVIIRVKTYLIRFGR